MTKAFLGWLQAERHKHDRAMREAVSAGDGLTAAKQLGFCDSLDKIALACSVEARTARTVVRDDEDEFVDPAERSR